MSDDTNRHGVDKDVTLDIYVTEDNDVLVKLSGFESFEEADGYAEYLNKNLSLLLFESVVVH